MIERSHAALFLDPGLGKTAITYAAFKILKKMKYVRRMLVIAPLRVAQMVWPAEKNKWEDFEDFDVAVLHGKNKDAFGEDHDIYVINYDGLKWLIDSGALDYLVDEKGVDMLVYDELSKMKHTQTKRFKLLKKHLHKFRRRYGLTGSPAPNGLMDLFGQVYALDRGKRLGEYITHFRNRFFIPAGYMGYDWKPLPGAEKMIHTAIKDLAMYMAAEDYLDLPPQVDNVIEVELDDASRKVYNAMHEELVSNIMGQGRITAPSAAAALAKCRQIANGAVWEDAVDPVTGAPKVDRGWHHLHDAKLEAVQDLIEEHQGQQILIAYEFRHDRERLLKALPKGTPYIGGGTNDKAALKIEKDWNAGQVPILLGHPQSIGHGLNLQGSNAHVIIWFSPTWDYDLYDQFNRRLLRQGNKAARIIVHHIVAKKTVDESIAIAIRSKHKTQQTLLNALRR